MLTMAETKEQDIENKIYEITISQKGTLKERLDKIKELLKQQNKNLKQKISMKIQEKVTPSFSEVNGEKFLIPSLEQLSKETLNFYQKQEEVNKKQDRRIRDIELELAGSKIRLRNHTAIGDHCPHKES